VDDYADFLSLSPGRAGAIVAGLLGLAGLIIGGLALRRNKRGTPALVLGLVAMALGGLVVVTADGGLGTGNGLGGGYVALVVGLISAVLGAARMRRRAATTGSGQSRA
jgi:lysophospholipid acyltransferase (LPLAT)-like uncharacterized protein